MKIIRKKGNRGEGDKKYFIKQEDGRMDGINIIENCILANQIILNELRINKPKIDKYGNFLFTNAMSDAITLACLGFDLWKDENLIRQLCMRWWLPNSSIPEMIDEEDENGSS